jgi:ferredoxin/flavodoxin---NADP+ reductase
MIQEKDIYDITVIGEGPTAVNNAKAYMDPKAKVQPLHSTSLFA